MKNAILVALLTFSVYIDPPMRNSRVYKDVQSFFARNGYYCLILKNNKTVYVPIMFTVIEEN